MASSAPRPSDVPDLLVYPNLWQASLAQCPAAWPDQLRVLCSLARGYQHDPGGQAPPALLGDGERMLLDALARLDVAEMIVAIATEFPGEPNPLDRLDPEPRRGSAKLVLVS